MGRVHQPAIRTAVIKGLPIDLTGATTAHRDLARWLLEREISVDAGAPGVAVAAERIWQKLSRPLSRLASEGGGQAILSRALHIARRDFPFLEGVRAGIPPESSFEGLGERIHTIEADEARQGLLAVLKILLDLLAGFIGDDLTLRLLLEVWSDLPVREPSRSGHSDGQEAAS
jgi:hypothetical protein